MRKVLTFSDKTHQVFCGRFFWALICLAAMPLMIGCGQDGPKRVVVRGNVTFGGQPLKSGQIRLIPKPGTKAPMSGANIVDGKYDISAKGGAVSGTYRVEIESFVVDEEAKKAGKGMMDDIDDMPPRKQIIPTKYNKKTTLEIVVKTDDGVIEKDFALDSR